MKQFIVFLGILAMGSAATFPSGLRVKFGIGLQLGKELFMDMPRTVENAIKMGWTQMERPTSPLPTLVMYCMTNYTLCTLYDPETNFIGGLQVAICLDDFTGATYDWTEQGFNSWTPVKDGCNYMTKQLYFISEDTLAKSTEERQQTAEEGKVLQEDNVWPVGFNQERKAVPTNAAGIIDAGFTKQNCIPWMGTHYFYNMTSSLECAANTLFNWFALVDSDNLIGSGMILPGVVPEYDGQTYYFERPSTTAVKAIVGNRPDCLVELADNPTFTTIHFYFIDTPWNVGCLLW